MHHKDSVAPGIQILLSPHVMYCIVGFTMIVIIIIIVTNHTKLIEDQKKWKLKVYQAAMKI